MNERTRNLLGVSVSLLIAWVLFSPPAHFEAVSEPTTIDRDAKGYFAIYQWVKQSSYNAVSWRRRFYELPETRGNVMIMTWPVSKHIEADEWDHFRGWLQQGNRLIVLVSTNYTEDWMLERTGSPWDLLEEIGWDAADEDDETGPDVAHEDEAAQSESESEEEASASWSAEVAEGLKTLTEKRKFTPSFQHPLFEGVDEIELLLPWTLSRDYFSGNPVTGMPLLEDEDGVLAWLLSSEEIPGGVFVFGSTDVFGNQGVFEVGNRMLLNNLLAHTAYSGSTIYFDDFHQGLTEVYDASSLFSDPKFWASLAGVIVFWMASMVLYKPRLGPVTPNNRLLRISEFTERMSMLFARHSNRQEVNESLLKNFNNAYRESRHLPMTGKSVATYVSSDHRFDRQDLQGLQNIESRIDLSVAVVQRQLHHLYQRFI